MKILLTVPVYNEEKIISKSIQKLHNYMSKEINQPWEIAIISNGSKDKTRLIIKQLEKKYSHIIGIHIRKKGRGNALKYVWLHHNADIYAYCDIDLATKISSLKNLFNEIKNGSNIVIGSRYHKKSKSKRNFIRFILSRSYIYFCQILFKTNINDFQCGFKAIDKNIVKNILPKIKNENWFFDTELLLKAEKKRKYKIKEIPINWTENENSNVIIPLIICQFIKECFQLKKQLKIERKN
jgi:glycosyltransferase involved in cell wall biosynthesis